MLLKFNLTFIFGLFFIFACQNTAEKLEELTLSALKNEREGDLQGAIQDYNKAIELDPNYYVAYNNRASLKKALGDKQGAMQDYNKAIEINPESLDAYWNRGFLYKITNNLEAACTDWRKASELGVVEAYDLIKKYCQ